MTNALKTFRLEKGLTLDALAAQSGVSKPTLSRIENGRGWRRGSIVEKLCAYTGLSPSVFFFPHSSSGETAPAGTGALEGVSPPSDAPLSSPDVALVRAFNAWTPERGGA